MPVITALTTQVGQGSITLIGADGHVARTSIKTDSQLASFDTKVADLATAIGKGSNAAVIGYNVTGSVVDDPASRTVYDEAFASVVTKAVFVFQSQDRHTRRLDVPAPDASMFQNDGQTVNSSNPLAADIIAKYKAVVDGDTHGPYQFVRGFLSAKTRKVRTRRDRPTIAEPSGVQLPPPAPAV